MSAISIHMLNIGGKETISNITVFGRGRNGRGRNGRGKNGRGRNGREGMVEEGGKLQCDSHTQVTYLLLRTTLTI